MEAELKAYFAWVLEDSKIVFYLRCCIKVNYIKRPFRWYISTNCSGCRALYVYCTVYCHFTPILFVKEQGLDKLEKWQTGKGDKYQGAKWWWGETNKGIYRILGYHKLCSMWYNTTYHSLHCILPCTICRPNWTSWMKWRMVIRDNKISGNKQWRQLFLILVLFTMIMTYYQRSALPRKKILATRTLYKKMTRSSAHYSKILQSIPTLIQNCPV